MSLCSCSTISSSLKRSESSNSYRLLPSSSSSITTVSSQSINEQQDLITDDEQWPAPPEEEIALRQNIVQDNWRIEKNISLKDQPSNKNSCILKATMMNEQILVCDSSSSSFNSRIIPGKHISMKVVFNL